MLRLIACLWFCLGLATPVAADSDQRPVDHFTITEAADFSKQIEHALADRGAFIALVFSSGRDRARLPDGVRYTHGAFWVYGPIETAEGDTSFGYAVYNLYHDAQTVTRSYLAQDRPLDFTRGDVVGQVGIIIPSADMQARLLQLITSPTYEALHQPAYSLLSNPTDLRFQNCTEFMLDILSAAAWNRTDRTQIKINLDAWFQPTQISVPFWQRWTAGWFDRRIRFEDHNGPVEVATYESIADFMTRYGLAAETFELDADFLTYR